MPTEDDFQAEPPRKPKRRPRPRPRDEDDDYDDSNETRFNRETAPAILPYHNPRSLIAYYCGVFSLIPCAALALGPIALTYGILAVRYAKRNPDAGGTGHGIAGIVLGGITTLINYGFVLLFVGAMVAASLRR
jgi:hypothetical protein